MKRAIKLLAALCCLSLLYSPAVRADTTVGKGEIVLEQSTRRVLSGSNTTLRLPMASTTKIMTCLIALEEGNLTDIVTVSENAAGVEGSSLYLKAGEELSLEELLYGLMLRSGNDAAVAIAEHIGGSVEGFVERMNRRARELGAADTLFANPHGLPQEGHYTTAYDLALITARAYEVPGFERIVSTESYRISANNLSPARTIANKNKMLASFEGCVGGKTGYTREAGRCLVSSARRDGMQLICVVLSCYEMYARSTELLKAGFSDYRMREPLTGTLSLQVKKNRAGVAAARVQGLKAPLSEAELPLCRIRLYPETLIAPFFPGDRAGKAVLYLGEEEIASGELVICETVPADTYPAVLERVLNRLLWKIETMLPSVCKNILLPVG